MSSEVQSQFNSEVREKAQDATLDTKLRPEDSVDLPGELYAGAHVEDKSPGVLRVEAIASVFTSWHRWLLFFFLFIVAYTYGLDGTLRVAFQPAALASFGASAQTSTVTVVRAIVAAAVQPVYAKVSDYFGRMSILIVCVFFYSLGIIIQATSKNVGAFSGGGLLNQIGYTGIMLLVEVIIADTSSLRNRLFCSFIPAAPFIINAWVTGTIADLVLTTTVGWEWGIGMWAVIFPVVTIPLAIIFFTAKRRAAKLGLLEGLPRVNVASPSLWLDFFWKIDIIGLFLLAATLALILIPFTLADGTRSLWKTARVIAPLVVGFCVALPLFVIWELKFARHPLFPGRLLRDRQIYCALAMAALLNTTWYTQGDYLYYTLIVAFNKDIETATRVTMIYSFVSVIVGLTLGLVVRYVRRLKYFIIAGALMIILAFGLLIRYRGGDTVSDFAGLVGGEVILGIAGGLLPYPTQVLIQAAVKHERTAIVTSLFYCAYNVGTALGNTIAGGIWTNTLPGHILNNMNARGVANATVLAESAYADPFTFVGEYVSGTVEREALNAAYREVQRLLCITGICLAVVLFAFSLGLRDTHLGDKQSNDDAEEEASETQSR